MSNYFSYFPKVGHDLTENGRSVELTNILKRFAFRSSVMDRADVFYDYDIQSGDRPDTIAEKYYGSANYAWVVLHFNNIIDPVFDLPLFNQDFENYIKGKYGNISTAMATVHEYRQVLNAASVKFDGTIIEKRAVVVDEDTYNSLTESERELITKYQYEEELNEQKRKIKILDKRYLPKLRDEVEDILRNGI